VIPEPGPFNRHVLILGTGIGGLSAALKFASQDFDVTIATKAEAIEGATRYAQGGIASVWSKDDSFDEHIHDTLVAGAGLCDPHVVELCVREGPARVRELIALGVEFTRVAGPGNSAEYDLHREGGHGKRRILHADDLTGLAIERALLAKAREHSKIRFLEHHMAIDLITEGKLFGRFRRPGRCLGAYVLDTRRGEVQLLTASVTVLATGGAGKVYLYTSNPDTATGDGIAMAHRAGAEIAHLEFMQFHPTCLYHPTARTFLLTEALRGEGAILRNDAGEDFVRQTHELGSLAPRDVVARAIDAEIKRTGAKHVWLDATRLPKVPDEATWRAHFPNIYELCASLGMNPAREPIPVVPAAHYTCGGVVADAHGQTSIEGLYAVGEVARTGLHGANRLASNSLLEAVVFAHRAALHAASRVSASESGAAIGEGLPAPKAWDTGSAIRLEEQIDVAAHWLEVRSLMWNYVGIVRSDRRLQRAQDRLRLIHTEVTADYWRFLPTKGLLELRNLVEVAMLTVDQAIARRESIGLHYTVDYPRT